MLTLEEAADAFTVRFTADVAARGAEMAWLRWPEKDHSSGIEQVIAYWMWPAADPASASPHPEYDEEDEDKCVENAGFWFQLRHRQDSAGPFPDGYAEFTIFIGGGKWMYEYGVSVLADMHGGDDPDTVVVEGERLPRHAEADGTAVEFHLVYTMKGGRAEFNPYAVLYLRCPRCTGFATVESRHPAPCACGFLAPDADGGMRAEDGATHRIAIYQSGMRVAVE